MTNEEIAQRIIDEKLANAPGSIQWSNEWLKSKIVTALTAKDTAHQKELEEAYTRWKVECPNHH